MMAVTSAAIAAPRSPRLCPTALSSHAIAMIPQLEAPYTVDAVWLPVAEERNNGACGLRCRFCHDLKGRRLGGEYSHRQTGSARGSCPERRRGDDLFHMDFLKDDEPVAGFRRAVILVAVRKHGEWKVRAGQLTKETLAPAG